MINTSSRQEEHLARLQRLKLELYHALANVESFQLKNLLCQQESNDIILFGTMNVIAATKSMKPASSPLLANFNCNFGKKQHYSVINFGCIGGDHRELGERDVKNQFIKDFFFLKKM